MKTLIPILNRIILAFGMLIIFSPVLALGGFDNAPEFVIIPCFLLGIVWFGVYLYGFQKIYNKYVKTKTVEGTSLTEHYKKLQDVQTVQTLKNRFEQPNNKLRQEIDINQEAIKETFVLRLQIFIIVAVFVLIYIAQTVKI